MPRTKSIPNRKFDTPVFLEACRMAGIPPTKRQASRWRQDRGLARRFVTAAIIKLGKEARAQ